MEFATLLGTLYLAAASFVCLLGLVIFRENPGQRLNRAAALMLLLGGFGAVLGATDYLVRSLRPEGTVLLGGLVANFAYLWEFFFPALVLFAATFPQPRPWLSGRRLTTTVLFVPHTFHFGLVLAASLLGPEFKLPELAKAVPFLGLPLTVLRVFLDLLYRAHSSLFALVNVAYATAAMVLLARSLARARNPRLRGQLRVICLGLGFSLACYLVAIPLARLAHLPLSRMMESSLLVLGLLAGSASIAYAIVRHRFLDTRLIARRSILYGVVSVMVVVVYLGAVKPVGDWAVRFTGGHTGVFETFFVVIALLIFQPLVGRLEEAVDRHLLGFRSDHRRALERLSLDVVTILDQPVLARRLIDALSEGLLASHAVLVARDPRSGEMQSLAHREADPARQTGNGRQEMARALDLVARRLPPQRTGPLRPEELLALFDESEESTWAETCVSLVGTDLLLPLKHGEELVGMLALGPKITATRYTAEEIVLLETLANQTAVALKNAALHRDSLVSAALDEELAVARQIQQAFLPRSFPDLGPFDVRGINIPSRQVGGDYYDVMLLDDGRFLLAVADVAGKGVPAALLMSMLKASLRTEAWRFASVSDVIARLNRLVFESTTPEKFATFFLGVVDPVALTLTYCNAGHDPPVLWRGDGAGRGGAHDAEIFCRKGGLILGFLEEPDYEECSVTLRPGDRLVLYTDGVTEARDAHDREFGVHGLLETLGACEVGEAPEATVDRLVATVMALVDDVAAMDDLTLLVMRVRGA